MNYILLSKIVQAILSVVLVGLILLQSKGGGLASAVGNSFSMYRSRRGVEKVVFFSTITVGVLLVANSLLLIILG